MDGSNKLADYWASTRPRLPISSPCRRTAQTVSARRGHRPMGGTKPGFLWLGTLSDVTLSCLPTVLPSRAGRLAIGTGSRSNGCEEQIAARALPVWWVREAPRHPSRWQRYTLRQFPDVDYEQAIRHALQRRSSQPSNLGRPTTPVISKTDRHHIDASS